MDISFVVVYRKGSQENRETRRFVQALPLELLGQLLIRISGWCTLKKFVFEVPVKSMTNILGVVAKSQSIDRMPPENLRNDVSKFINRNCIFKFA